MLPLENSVPPDSWPGGLNITITDDFPGQTRERLAGYDLLVLWTTLREPPA
jgi:hypothetical protein